MLSFFRLNDPYRLVFALIVLLAFRLPVIISGIPLSVSELNWMLVGEAMANGKMMYRDIWDDISPLAAFVYQLVDYVFGKSQLAYQVLSLFLVFYQSIVFNQLLLENKAFNENTYVPALVYVVCASSHAEFLTLSPQLMSMTFVLLAINNIFKRIDNLTRDELFLNAGLLLSLSTLFYLPSCLFLLSTLLSLVLFSSTIPRRLMLLSFGYLQLILIVLFYYYWNDSAKEFYYQFINSAFTSSRNHLLPVSSLGLVLLVKIFFLLISAFKLLSRNYYVKYKLKFQSVKLITMITALLTLLLEPTLSVANLLFLIPGIAFFLSHLFLLIEKRMKAEIVFIVFLMFDFGYQYALDKEVKWVGQLVDYTPLAVRDTEHSTQLTGKKILVLGNSINHYRLSSVATPYLNWELSQHHLGNLDHYDVMTDVFKNFERDLPEVILDLENIAPNLMDKMPTISKKYVAADENIYYLKE